MLLAPLLLSLALPLSGLRELQEPDEDLRDLVAGLVEAGLVHEKIPGAAVVVVREGGLVLAEGFGLADVASQRAVDAERTLWRIGSISKSVTALGVLALADRGQLALDDPVEAHVPGLVPAVDRFDEPVRIRHLLEHMGGFDQIGTNRNFADPSERPSLRAFLARDLVRIRPAGEARCYDTYGISLAGEVVSVVTEESYPEAMAKLVFAPLGMQNTWVEAPEEARKELATGYGLANGELVPQEYEYYASLPASSIDATAVDMGRLIIALLGDGSNDAGRLLSEKGVSALQSDRGRDAGGRGFPQFAFGFWGSSLGRAQGLHHGGTMRGYSGELTLLPEWGLGIFIAVNRDGETGPPVALLEHVTSAVIRFHEFDPEEPELAPAKGHALATESLTGTYTQNLWCHTCPEGEGWPPREFVSLRAAGGDAIELWGERWERCAPREFQRPGHRGRIGFELNASGNPARFVLSWTPGTVYERLDEALVEEVLGPQVEDSPPHPLVAIVHRANERWEPAARTYAALAANYDSGRPARALADYYAGQAFARQGLPEPAEAHLLVARDSLQELAESGAPGAEFFLELSRMSILEVVIAHAQAGDANAAIEWLELAIEDLGIPARAALGQVASNPWLAPLRGHARLESLGK